jgi:hypothetical protein
MPRTISAARKSAPSVGPRRILASKAARKSAPSSGPRRRVLASKAARKSAPSSSSYTRQDEAIDLVTDDGTSSSDEESPASFKRSRTTVEDTPNKIAKLSGIGYVKDLEKQIEDLHAFIIRKNLILGRLLDSVSTFS